MNFRPSSFSLFLLFLASLLVFCLSDKASYAEAPTEMPAAGAVPDAAGSYPSSISLAPGQIQTIAVSDLSRVAVGDPSVADVSILSPKEILVQAKRSGLTNLILWDAQGQHQATISVGEASAPERRVNQISQLLKQLNLGSVQVQQQGSKTFLTGQVASKAQLDALERITETFGNVTNLVEVTESVSQPPAQLVKLSVQVLELSRTDLDKLGVQWSQGFAITEPSAEDLTLNDALTKWGTTLTRGSVAATISALVQKNKARLLAEPKLVTADGKEATTFVGVEVPVIKSTSVSSQTTSVNASIEFRQTGVTLKMTPHISNQEDQKITTTVSAEVSKVDNSVALTLPVGSQSVAIPGFNSRKVDTEVTTLSGETIMIAGLLEAQDSETVAQVPGLGNIPVVGRLFRSPQVDNTRRELVIAITPEMLLDEATQTDKKLAMEQALAIAEVTASVDDPKLRYALQIQERIAKAMRFPQRERELGMGGRVKLRLHIFADGTLGKATVTESSGIEALDAEALKAAETQAPYPPFANQLSGQDAWLEIPVIFRL